MAVFSSLCTRACAVLLVALAAVTSAAQLTGHAQQMLQESMTFLDTIYDAKAGYLYYFYYPQAAGRHETRSSIWYAAGLLQRNQTDDAENAIKIIRNVIADQEKNASVQWFGDYTVYPEQPTVGSPAYAPVIYNSWDPNWRGFIGTALMVVYEEFGDALPDEVRELILDSLRNCTVGDSYRVGGVDGDNLYPAYSNPSLMRAVASGWTGRRVGDANMTAAGEAYAREVLDLFDRNNTLSEFNSPTYVAVSLYALTLWAKYMPKDSIMSQTAPRMIQQIWTTTAHLYNPNLRNLSPPWDRSYGYDMNNYVAILSLYIWSLAGKSKSPLYTHPWTMTHADDLEIAPLLAILAPFHDALVPEDAVARLSGGSEEGTFYETAAYSPPHDRAPRNVSAWVRGNLSMGAQSFDQDVVGGFSMNQESWNPAGMQWLRARDGSVGFMTLYATETAMMADLTPASDGGGVLNLTYPGGGADSVFTFVVASNPPGGKRDMAGLGDVEGVTITVVASGSSVVPEPVVSFCGLVGGTCPIIHGFEFWNFTFVMPAGSTETPAISLAVELA